MPKIVVDAVLRRQLQAINQPVDLCDESGQVLGRFVPAVDSSQESRVGPQVSDEELRRRTQAREGFYTTAEILAHLEKL
jgi:hypothetical protein